MSSPVDENVLNQLKGDQSELLNKIDELRTFGVGDPVEPPQIVVCGNQSSGKSSVLEAISRVHFPVGTNICTRFATEIILRRHPSERIKVSIEPGNSRDDVKEREKLHALLNTESFSSGEDLPALIEAAKECMGLSDVTADLTPNSGFTDDVLRVEISGPDLPELTLVDLPGLYPSTRSEQGEPGMKIVQSLTEHYMTNPRTIIFFMISARDDFHSQKVLNIAQQFDPKYERVLGIVTQPDIPAAGSEDYHLRLIRNEEVKLQLGWHVLCNRSPETIDLSDTARDVKEKEFFNKGRWASLPREQVGIESLRNHLSTILLAHTGRSLSGLIFTMQEKLLRNEQALIELGTSRISVQQQRLFLINISSKFSRITNQALNGFYVDEFFGGYEDAGNTEERPFRRLRAIIRELNEYFARAMSIRGQRRIIQVSPLHEFDLVLEASNPYLLNWTPTYIKVESLHEEIRQKAREIPGIELPGSVKQLLVGSLFRDQCKPWKGIAKAHILNVWSAVEYFVQLVLKYLVDDQVRASMMRHLISPRREKMKETLMEKLDEIFSYYKRGHPLPLGNAYLRKMRDFVSDRQPRIDLARVAGAVIPPQPPDESCSLQIIDQMQAYYDVSPSHMVTIERGNEQY
jgi:hypothetical protein